MKLIKFRCINPHCNTVVGPFSDSTPGVAIILEAMSKQECGNCGSNFRRFEYGQERTNSPTYDVQNF